MKYPTGRKLFAVLRDDNRGELHEPAFQISRRLIHEPKLQAKVSYEIGD
jgi:hypothetical protein